MGRQVKYLVLFLLALWAPCSMVEAQRMINVHGRILNATNHKPFGTKAAVEILCYNTETLAQDDLKMMGVVGFMSTNATIVYADPEGYYEANIADNGAIIVHMLSTAPHYEPVNGRNEINLSIEAGFILDEVRVLGEGPDVPQVDPGGSITRGDTMVFKDVTLPPLKKEMQKANARLILQPLVVDVATEDTVAYLNPLVIDGTEFRSTQLRRMDFNLQRNDPLYSYYCDTTHLDSFKGLVWNGQYIKSKSDHNYQCFLKLLLEDYTKVYHESVQVASTRYSLHPFRFLELPTRYVQMDPMKFLPKPRREKRSTFGGLQLTFLLGKAVLDNENPENEKQLNKLKQDLTNLLNDPDATLKDLEMTAVSSPEGSYATNQSLSLQRARYAMGLITEVIPAYTLQRMRVAPEAIVAGWDEVIPLIQENWPDTADKLRQIIEATSNRDQQYQRVSQLPEYKAVIEPVLPQLRTIRFKYQHELYREMGEDDIYDKYLHDEDFRSGKKQFTLYEYWHLFNKVKDEAELERLYKRAYDESLDQTGRPWPLAANNLACSYLKRDTFDLQILQPFILRSQKKDGSYRGLNVEWLAEDGMTTYTMNYEEMVLNQLAMAMKAYDMKEVGEMCKMLKGEERYQHIQAIGRCFVGDYENANKEYLLSNVKQTSSLNSVMVAMLPRTEVDNAKAKAELFRIKEDNAIVLYLKAQLASRDLKWANDRQVLDAYSYEEEVKNALFACFDKNSEFIEKARTDAEFEYKDDIDRRKMGKPSWIEEWVKEYLDQSKEGEAIQ